MPPSTENSTPRPQLAVVKDTGQGTSIKPDYDFAVSEEAAPELPIDLLPAPLRDFVRDTAYRMQAPADLVAIPALCSAGTMLGQDVRVQPKRNDTSWTERPALWGVGIALPSTGKSPAASAALKPIERLQAELHEEYLKVVQETLTENLRRPKEEAQAAPPVETVLLHDATGEALYRVMSPEHNGNARGALLYRDELAGFFKALDKYRPAGGDDRQFFLQAWSGGPFNSHRVKGNICVPDCYISIYGTTQPDVARELFGKAREDGMTARFGLAVMVEPLANRLWVDQPPNEEAIERFDRRLQEMRKVPACTLRFDEAAARAFERWYLQLQARPELRDGSSFGLHIGKYDALFARLALVFHFLEHGAAGAQCEIGLAVVTAVQQFIDGHLEPHARRLYKTIEAHVLAAGAQRIARWIKADCIQKFTTHDILSKDWKEFNRERAAALIEDTLNYLEAKRWVRRFEQPPGPQGGRPTVKWIVNTEVHGAGRDTAS